MMMIVGRDVVLWMRILGGGLSVTRRNVCDETECAFVIHVHMYICMFSQI